MSNDNNSGSGGVGCLGVIGIVFVILKLVGVIDWSWWWVLSPFIASAVLLVAFLWIVVILKDLSR